MSRIAVLGLVFVVGALGCDACAHAVVVPPTPIPVAVDASDVCASACQAAATCGCPFAVASHEPECEQACRRDQQQGAASQLAPSCLASATDCNALKACQGVTGCP
jgi:hypothetical protein